MKLTFLSLLLSITISGYCQDNETETETIEFSFDRSVHADLPTTEDKESLILEGDIAYKIDRSGSHPNALLWPKGILIYDFADKSPAVVKLVKEAMRQIETDTNIRFKQRTNERDYVLIGTDQQGCWSHIGRTGGAQPLNLQLNGCLYKGTIMHEFLHALGILHEQSRYDRDNHIIIYEENIYEHMLSNFSLVRHVGNGSYDINSIMHYPSDAFSKNGRPTITTVKGGMIHANREYLTSKDISGLNELYANQINGGSVRPSIKFECESEIAFVDTRSFDKRLHEKLTNSSSTTCVVFNDELFYQTELPERITEWLSAIKESNGKVEYQEMARGWLSKLIEFFVSIFSTPVDKTSAAQNYNALIQVDKGTRQVYKVIFYPR